MTSPPSSPQTPSSPPPIRYFDILPTELLQQIIDHLIPSEITFARRYERRKTVSSLRLVSKRFYQLAHPAFANTLWLGGRQGSEMKTGESHLWNNCRSLRLDMPNLTPEVKSNLEDIVRVATRIEAVACFGSASLINIVLASHLTKLHLYNVRLPLGFVFANPTLEQLSLSQVEFSNQQNLVHDLPSLRHIGYSPRLGGPGSIPYTFVASLAPELESMTTSLLDITPVQSLQQQYDKSTILLVCEISRSHTVPSSAQHLRIMCWAQFGAMRHRRLLDAAAIRLWIDFLTSADHSLKSLYLPASISTSNHSLTDSMRGALEVLEATCQQRKVEIIYEDLMSNHVLESLISQEFVRRVERGLQGS